MSEIIMDVEINMINVKNGDAIILMLKDNDRKALILIDGGFKTYHQKLEKRLAQLLPEFDNKIDLVICTHYDNDHLGGIEVVFDKYHDIIQEIWIHKIEDTIEDTIGLFENKIFGFEKKIAAKSNKFTKDSDSFDEAKIIEGYKELLRFITKIKEKGLEKKVIEATTDKRLNRFPEFKVVSPSPEYYNANLDAIKKDCVKEDNRNKLNEKLDKLLTFGELFTQNPCEELETSSENSVTAANMVSIVTLLEVNGKKYLFTGDAGIETFVEHIPNWEDDLKNLYFLDVPHHGSKHNTSKKMIEVFNPYIAFVSGANTSSRPSGYIKKCIQSKSGNQYFEVTNSDPENWYLKLDKEGQIFKVKEE